MKKRRGYREISAGKPDEERSRFDRERIVLALIGLAGAILIIAMNMRF